MDTEETAGTIVYVVLVLLSTWHVLKDCRRLGEDALWNVTGTLLLWPIFYLIGWLWIWPGSFRRWFSGGSVDDLEQAKATRRSRRKRSGAIT